MEKTKTKTLAECEALVGRGDASKLLESLFDEGTFAQIGRFVKRASTPSDTKDGNEFESVITGYGAIEGRLTFAFAFDRARMNGAMSAAAAEKIETIYQMALKAGAPVVGIYDCAGAKVLEGTAVLAAYGKVMAQCAKASGVIPQIAVVTGLCTGCGAVIASMADIVIATKEAQFYIGTPFVLKDEDAAAGSSGSAAESGAISAVTDDAAAAIEKAKATLALLPSNNCEGIAYTDTDDDAGRAISYAGTLADKLASLCDAGSVIELSADYACTLTTALASIGGISVGIVASNPDKKGGTLTEKAAKKAAKFVSFCDSFNIPVVTLVDSEGTAVCAKCEGAPYAASLARLASAYASSVCPKITVVTGKAYGSAFTLLGSKSLGADIEYALPEAQISILAPDAALEFVYGDEIRAAENYEEAKAAAAENWKSEYSSALAAARCGAIDDVIEESSIRAKLASALEMLSSKSADFAKKHGNLPL